MHSAEVLFSLDEVLNNCLHGSVPLYPRKAINVIMSLLNIIFMISFAFSFATGELATKQKSGKVVRLGVLLCPRITL